MNWSHFKKSNVGLRCQIEPIASHFSDSGLELPEVSDDWEITEFVGDASVVIRNCRTGHQIPLGKDHIYDYRSNPARSSATQRYGFLVLKVHLIVKGDLVDLRPNTRPGERVIPLPRKRIPPLWTDYIEMDLKASIPPNVHNANIQFRLWSDDPDIPLMIRVAHDREGTFRKESSGPSGVIDTIVGDAHCVYISFSHPDIHYEVGVSGFRYE